MTDAERAREFIVMMQRHFIRGNAGQSGELADSIPALAAFDRMAGKLAAANSMIAELRSDLALLNERSHQLIDEADRLRGALQTTRDDALREAIERCEGLVGQASHYGAHREAEAAYRTAAAELRALLSQTPRRAREAINDDR